MQQLTLGISSSLIPGLSPPLSQLLEMVYSHLQHVSLVGARIRMSRGEDLAQRVYTRIDTRTSAPFNQGLGEFSYLKQRPGLDKR